MKFINKTTLAFLILAILGCAAAKNMMKTKTSRSCAGSWEWECQGIWIRGPGGLCVSGQNHKGDLVQEACNNHPNELFNFIAKGNDIVTVQNKSGHVFDVAGGEDKNGAKVLSWDSHGGNNQQWRVNFVGNGNHVQFKNVKTNRCHDNTGTIAKKRYYHTWECKNDNKNQWFDIQLADGHKWFQIVDKNGKCVSSPNNNGDLKQEVCNKDKDGHLWAFLPYTSGYMIINKAGKVIDNHNNETKNGNKILNYTRNNGNNQMWRVENTKNGMVHFKSVQANKCMDDTGDLKRDYYHLWDCSPNNKNQYFAIRTPKTEAAPVKPTNWQTRPIKENPKHNMERDAKTRQE